MNNKQIFASIRRCRRLKERVYKLPRVIKVLVISGLSTIGQLASTFSTTGDFRRVYTFSFCVVLYLVKVDKIIPSIK